MSKEKTTMTLGEAVKATRAASARSILSLPPVLQAVWTAAYAATVQGVHAGLQSDERLNDGESAAMAERDAWEAVRRANGGEMPEDCEPDESRLAVLKEAIKQPCPVTGEPFFMVLKHPNLGWVPTYGGPYDSYTAPEKDADGTLSHWHYDHDAGQWTEEKSMCLRVVDTDAERPDPTDEEMVEALAPIIATAHHAGGVAAKTRAIRAARKSLQGEKSETWADHNAEVAIASWKAARAWGRK